MTDKIIEQPVQQTQPITRLFKLQITKTITANPKWFEIIATAQTDAHNKY